MAKLLLDSIIATFLLIGIIAISDFDDLNMNFNQIKLLIGTFNNENLLKAVHYGDENMRHQKTLEHRISRSHVKVANGTISHGQLIASLPSVEVQKIDNLAQTILKASSYLQNSFCKNLGISNKDCVKFMSQYILPESNLKEKCLSETNKSKFHSYRRLLPADYHDGLQKFRTSITGQDLPLARKISEILYMSGMRLKHNSHNRLQVNNDGVIDKERTMSLVQFAQFIEHDLTKTVVQTMENGTPIECCNNDYTIVSPRYAHPACKEIKPPTDDVFYKPLWVTCLNYVRSGLAVQDQCRFGGSEQLNYATNKLDLSQLYGLDESETRKLRSFYLGELKISHNYEYPLLPTGSENCLHNNLSASPCYQSSDSRVNANPYLTILYTIFLRSHNQIAHKLKRLNPDWVDQQLFVLAKRINIAIYQKLVYTDWADIILGKRMAQEIRVKKEDNEDSKKFKSKKVSNEFATAVIRFYNSMMPGDLLEKPNQDSSYVLGQIENNSIEQLTYSQNDEILKLQDVQYKPIDLSKPNYLETIQKAILQQNAMAMDSSYVDDLSLQNLQTKSQGKTFGADSLAFDIQRGRDHGLSSYVNYIKKYMNVKISKWDDLKNIVKEDDLLRLKSVYSSFEDIDLIVGGLCEIPLENATIGPTFSYILSDQLTSTKLSDMKFYDRKSPDDDIEKISKTVETYSPTRLLCDTTKLKKVQKNIFLLPSNENPEIDCSDYHKLPRLDLSYWLDH